jgi:putative SOS response-associated peptidase YedK
MRMCGRINVSDHEGVQQLLQRLGIKLNKDSFTPRFNVAPGADILVAFADAPHELAQMHWGIVPHWARDKPGARPLINARVETAWEKPSFRKLVQNTRAIVPVNGFYEWRRENKRKTPYYIKLPDQQAMALAAIYQVTREGTMEVAILTRESGGDMAAVHNRMPVTLDENNMESWLCEEPPEQIQALLASQSLPMLEITEVSSYVNNAANEGEKCVEPIAA